MKTYILYGAVGLVVVAIGGFLFFNQEAIPEEGNTSEIQETTEVDIHFSKLLQSDGQIACDSTAVQKKTVIVAEEAELVALQTLIKGVTSQEQDEGYFTFIHPDTEIYGFTIDEERVAHIDLSDDILEHLGNPCEIANVRAQIGRTMTQFPSIEKVVVQIEGNTRADLAY